MKQHIKQWLYASFQFGWFLIKLIAGIICFALMMKECKAQEKEFVTNGYTIDYPHFYYLVDTVKMSVQARNYYRFRHYVNVRFGVQNQFENDIEVYFGTAFTFPYQKGAIVTIRRKKFNRTYRII